MASDLDTGAVNTPPPNSTYVEMEADPRFAELRHRFRRFVFPATAAFLVWYLLYVLLSAYARGFMDTKLVGNFNVAFLFGLLQFVSTFGIAWAYARYADRNLDPIAAELRASVEAPTARTPATGTPTTETGAAGTTATETEVTT
jgi:uncharacterized membrane protein (DUF485 family)